MNARKLFVQRIGLVGITSLLLELSNIILLPILTKSLAVDDYGIWVQIVVTVSFVPAIAVMGLPYSLVRFLSSIKEREVIQEIFYSIAFTILITTSIASLSIFLFSNQLAYYLFEGKAVLIKPLSLIIFFDCFNGLFLNYFRSFNQIRKYSLFSFLRVFLNISLAIYLIQLGYGIRGAISALLIAVSLEFILMAFVIVSQIGIKIPRFQNIKAYISFGIPTVIGSISSGVVNAGDRYIIGIFLGAAYVGFYSPGYTLGNIIVMFVSPLSFLLPVILSKQYDDGNIDEVKLILGYSLKYFLAIAIPSAFGLTILSKSILSLISTPLIASQGYLITPFTAISAIFFGMYAIISQILVLEKKTTIPGAIWVIVAAMNFGLNLLLIPSLGIIGAAVTTLLAYALAFILTAHYSQKYLTFQLDYYFILKSILASAIISSLLVMVNPSEKISIFIAVIASAFLYFIILHMLKSFKPSEIAFIKDLI
jgi:O-antigen/teichoic acid export membrane protein